MRALASGTTPIVVNGRIFIITIVEVNHNRDYTVKLQEFIPSRQDFVVQLDTNRTSADNAYSAALSWIKNNVLLPAWEY